jgi:uncharacterized protein with ParB-like and HNH nuclease domain
MPQSERFRIQEIMGNRVRYCVPSFYQRSYVWTLEKQWEDLWADILRKTNELISAENKLKDDPSFKPRIANHFMGAFVVNAVLSYGFNPPRKDVIDGQQRLTTIQLLIHAFSHVAALIFGQDSQLVSQLDVYTRNINAKDEYEFKVWPTEADQALFSKMLKSKSQGEVMQKLGLDTPSIAKNQKQKSTGIDGAYFYFYDEILAYIRKNRPK